MTDNHSERAEKAFKKVADAATDARRLVTRKMREAQADIRKEHNEKLSREAKRLKRDKHMSNHQIAEKLELSESSVRALLIMKIEGEV